MGLVIARLAPVKLYHFSRDYSRGTRPEPPPVPPMARNRGKSPVFRRFWDLKSAPRTLQPGRAIPDQRAVPWSPDAGLDAAGLDAAGLDAAGLDAVLEVAGPGITGHAPCATGPVEFARRHGPRPGADSRGRTGERKTPPGMVPAGQGRAMRGRYKVRNTPAASRNLISVQPACGVPKSSRGSKPSKSPQMVPA